MSVLGDALGALEKGWESAKRAFDTGLDIVKDAAARVLTAPEFALCVLGARPQKYLKLKFYILRRNGVPVLDPVAVIPLLQKTSEIFRTRANITVTTADPNEQFVEVMSDDAPPYALQPPEPTIGSIFSDAVAYFSARCSYRRSNPTTMLESWGYGDPIFLFVVETMDETLGIHYALSSNFCLVAADAPLTTPAHEIGHACDLIHISANNNLMKPTRNDKDRDSALSDSQVCVIRSSRFVTFMKDGSGELPEMPAPHEAPAVAGDVQKSGSGWFWLLWS